MIGLTGYLNSWKTLDSWSESYPNKSLQLKNNKDKFFFPSKFLLSLNLTRWAVCLHIQQTFNWILIRTYVGMVFVMVCYRTVQFCFSVFLNTTLVYRTTVPVMCIIGINLVIHESIATGNFFIFFIDSIWISVLNLIQVTVHCPLSLFWFPIIDLCPFGNKLFPLRTYTQLKKNYIFLSIFVVTVFLIEIFSVVLYGGCFITWYYYVPIIANLLKRKYNHNMFNTRDPWRIHIPPSQNLGITPYGTTVYTDTSTSTYGT